MDRRRFIDSTTTTSDDPRRIPAPPGPRGPLGSIVLRGGRVIDGTGPAAREGSVVIERNRITRILPAGSSEWPRDARVIDVAGKTVMPGLIDLHTHFTIGADPGPGVGGDTTGGGVTMAPGVANATLRAVEKARYYIESGITSVRDVASREDVPFRLKAWINAHLLPGPRIFAVGKLITGKGGHGAEGYNPSDPTWGAVREASGPDDWRLAVREQFDAGADAIKLASHFSREEVKAAVDEAHALGLKVVVDAETFYIQWAVEAGADDIEHPLPRTDETIQLMAQKGTQSVPDSACPTATSSICRAATTGAPSRRFSFSKEANLEMLRRLKRAGVKLGIGTDLVGDWFRYMPLAYITELKHFVQAGFTIPEVLSIATRTNAQILAMDDKLGTLEPGKLADVLVVDGRPDVSLDDLAKVDIVIRDGEVVVRGGQIVIPRHTARAEPASR